MVKSKKTVSIGNIETLEESKEEIPFISSTPITDDNSSGDDEVIEKPKTNSTKSKEKKPRSEKQLEAFRKARERLVEKQLKSKEKKEQEKKELNDFKKELENKKIRKMVMKQKKIEKELATSSEDEEEEIVVKKVKKPKKTKKIVYVSDDDDESDTGDNKKNVIVINNTLPPDNRVGRVIPKPVFKFF